MRYQPSLLTKNNNISPSHPIKEFAVLLLGLTIFLAICYLILGFLVDFSVRQISPARESAIFSHVPMELFGQETKVPDPRLPLLQQITNELTEEMAIEIPITVHLKQSETINALAVPGGHIVIFSGLLDTLESENSLRFILAHELGHFTNRDHLRGLGRSLVLVAMATAVAGPDSSLTKLVSPTLRLNQAQYSQNRETAADETALHALNHYYGHVGGASEFFSKMAGEEEKSIGHYFSSHPEMKERVQNLKDKAEIFHYPIGATKPLSF